MRVRAALLAGGLAAAVLLPNAEMSTGRPNDVTAMRLDRATRPH